MPHWTVISHSEHAGAYFRQRDGYRHARHQLATPILLAELPKLVPHYVLGFVRRGDCFTAVALLGVEERKNLYVHPDGRWLGTYVPAGLRGYPFSLLPDEQGQRLLCVDADQLVSGNEGGKPLFGEDGQPSESVSSHLEFHKQCEANRQQTQRATDALQQAGVIQPWPLAIRVGESDTKNRVDGVYRIEEEVLNGLDADRYSTLQGGPMALAHAQLFAIHQMHQLTDRARFHEQYAESAPLNNLDSWFDGMDDDVLRFNFD